MNDIRFVNRTQEMAYLKDYLGKPPNSMLFVYGPKSSGKSVLLHRVVAELPPERFAVNFMNLREVLIYDFATFIDTFFPKTLYGKVKDLADGVTFNIGFFGLNVDDEKIVKQNPFKVMGEKLRAAQARGKQPVIILDEIQLLKNIYVNSTRYLIDELFNLFISLTKTLHAAHVIASTSDSYFIEELYNNVKLQKTMKFYYVDHLPQSEVGKWLTDEGLTPSDIETVWYYLNGCPWEIQQLLLDCHHYQSVEEVCRAFIHDEYGRIREFRNVLKEEGACDEFDRISKHIVQHGFYLRNDEEDAERVNALVKKMVEHDIWFYKTDEQKIVANSQSIFRAFEKLFSSQP